MKYFRIAFILGLALMIFAGCSKEEIQPDPLTTADEASFKKAMTHYGHHAHMSLEGHKLVPFKATFELAASFQHFGPISQIDFQTEWPFGGPAPGMHVIINGKGNATHLGLAELEIRQWWTRAHPTPPPVVSGFFSYGQGEITFTAANGDLLFATYWGWADHQDDPPTEILTFGTFTGGTGRFVEASGTFIWDGLFVGKFKPIPTTPGGTEFGTGKVKVTGSINY